jgi:hypothetical protein
MDIPETVWLPPEIRAAGCEERSRKSTDSVKILIAHHIECLNQRIEHVESVVAKIGIDERLRKLEHETPESVELTRRSGA